MGKSLAFGFEKIAVITARREGNARESNNGFDRSLEIERGFDANLPWLAIGSIAAGEDLASDLDKVILNTVGLDDFANAIRTMPLGNRRKISLQFWIQLLQGRRIQSDRKIFVTYVGTGCFQFRVRRDSVLAFAWAESPKID